MRVVQGLQRVFSRNLSLRTPPGGANHGSVPNTDAYKRVQDLQEHFLRDDGLLVWQKRGARDRIPYLASLFICVAGGAACAHSLTTLIFPKKSDE